MTLNFSPYVCSYNVNRKRQSCYDNPVRDMLKHCKVYLRTAML